MWEMDKSTITDSRQRHRKHMILEYKKETVMSDWLVGEGFLEEVIVELSLDGRVGRVGAQKDPSWQREQHAMAQALELHKSLRGLQL